MHEICKGGHADEIPRLLTVKYGICGRLKSVLPVIRYGDMRPKPSSQVERYPFAVP